MQNLIETPHFSEVDIIESWYITVILYSCTSISAENITFCVQVTYKWDLDAAESIIRGELPAIHVTLYVFGMLDFDNSGVYTVR